MTFKKWLRSNRIAGMYEDLAGAILNDPSFPDNPAKSPNRRYLRIEARYCGQYRLELFDDLWTEYVRDVLPKRTPDKRKTAEEIRQEMADDIISFIEDYRTGLNDDLLDKITDHVEMLVQGRKEREA